MRDISGISFRDNQDTRFTFNKYIYIFFFEKDTVDEIMQKKRGIAGQDT